MKRVLILLAALAALLGAASLYLRADSSTHPSEADSDGADAKAVLRNAAGDRVGWRSSRTRMTGFT